MSVLVIAEHREEALRDATFEALGAARALKAGPVTALVLAADPAPLARGLASFCDAVLTMAQPSLSPPVAAAWLPAVKAAVQEIGARLVLLPHSSWGMELAPCLAEELGGSLYLCKKCEGLLTKSSLNVKELGDYRLLSEIGRGAMGIVYKAVSRMTRRVRYQFTPNADKQAVYAGSVAALMRDQLAYVADPAHRRTVAEANGRESVAMAEAAVTLAAG